MSLNYVFLDFELNNAYNFKVNPKCKNEIIEIGAVKLNDNFEVIDTFQSLVKPDAYNKINPIILKLTKIKVNDLFNAQYFGKVLKSFTNWIGNEDNIIYTWSESETYALFENCDFHRIKQLYYPWINNIIDLQYKLTKIYEYKFGKNKIGLKKMLEYYKINIDKRCHRALNDAVYTSEIFIEANKRLGLKNVVKLYSINN